MDDSFNNLVEDALWRILGDAVKHQGGFPMYIFKGDRVRLVSGKTGEVTETWGIARTFIRLLCDSDGKTIPVFATDVVEVRRAKPSVTTKGNKRGR
ncbi:hypothetical protein HQN90_17675 [Paenibacillus alba]|nr:hypothetical protein [Paenibacillus alba]